MTTDPAVSARLAAYAVTRERLDARRTQKVKCEPPNRQCGNRCIPPNWDCRLKGEGNDPHLRAVGKGSDPVAGFANLERGLARLRKGVTKLSFSELEGGRRSIARGAAKLTPGDLQKKKEVQERVNQFAVWVGGPLAVAVFAGLAHRGMKAFPAYARGPGAQVDQTMDNVFRTVARNTPVYGQRVRAREAAGPTAVAAVQRSVGSVGNLTPERFSENASTRSRITQFVTNQPTLTEQGFPTTYSKLIDRSLRSADGAVNNGRKPSGMAYSEWERKSAQAFWTTPRTQDSTPPGVDPKGGTIFSVLAANDHISRSFGFPTPSGSDTKAEGTAIVNRLTEFFKASGSGVRTSMQELGLNTKSPEAVAAYISRAGGKTTLDKETLDILSNSIISNDYNSQAKRYYAQVVGGYDRVFGRIASDLAEAPSIELVQNRGSKQDIARLRQLRQTSFYSQASETHSEALARRINLPGRVYGPYTGLVAKRAYYTAQVAGPKRLANNDISIELTRTEATTAAAEIARATGIPEPDTVEASLELVRRTYGQGMGQYMAGNAIGRITLVTSTSRQSTNPPRTTNGQERPARRRRPRSASELTAIYERAGYSPEAARARAEREVAERRRRDARVDAYLLVREDFTPTNERQGKPCGKSFIGKNEKCSKPGAKGYANPEPGQSSSTGLMQNVGKVALAAGAVAGGVLAAKKGKSLYDNRRNNQTYTKFAPKAMNAAITRMSQKDIRDGLAKVPKPFRRQAEALVGKAKAAMAYVSADAQGYNLRKVNNDSNFSTWSTDDGSRVLTVGSVGDTLVTFNADRSSTIDLKTEGGRGVGVFDVQFSSDLGFQQKTGLSKEDQNGISKMLKTMNTDTMANLPRNAVLRNIPFAKDGLGKKRAAIYKRMKYKSIKGIRGEAMFATLDNGKVVAIDPQYEDFYADLLKGDDYDTAVKKFQERGRRDSCNISDRTDFTPTSERKGKPCGNSFIRKNQKCTKGQGKYTALNNKKEETGVNNTLKKVAIGVGATAAVGGVAAIAALGVRHSTIKSYRKNVSKSAIEAEKLALELERSMRQQAATRLNKPIEKVTGFEASTYNFKDKGHDRGFGSSDNNPAWFGQTKDSRGAIVMLSYADDNKFTTRGQGSYKLAEGGVFKEIWGEHDILPFANNISQPNVKTPDDLTLKRRENTAARARQLGGELGEKAYKTAYTVKDLTQRFAFLKENIDRGHNPDAIRAAAFVVAQRRLTGKPVNIMAYSNGGNVASETLAILREMGYRDVKVVNVAGPTFGMFEHSRDNMRTWLSEGDEFYKYFNKAAFNGSNPKFLDNKRIPHGITDALDPNNREYGATAQQNRRERRSYMLDEQLRKEAYTYLTVDRKRSAELVDEIVWRVSENNKFEGDLKSLYGEASDSVFTRYTQLLTKGDKEKAKEAIRDEIEDRMIEVWYGGYNSSKVKNRAKQLRKAVQAQAVPPRTGKPARPKTLSERTEKIMQDNPSMTRQAALKQAKREMLKNDDERLITYCIAYDLMKQKIAAG